jgi:hypothetical protein
MKVSVKSVNVLSCYNIKEVNMSVRNIMQEIKKQLYSVLIGISLMTPSILGQTLFVDIQKCNPHFLKQRKKQFCYVSFVSINGIKYLVKQKRKKGFLLSAVFDALGSHIAESLDEKLAHKVIIIPALKSFVGKRYIQLPATLHTFAPGRSIKKQWGPYRKMNMKRYVNDFSRDIIFWMAKHPQLAQVVALDIFLCNHDRHRGNLFYNARTDSFCAIDMDGLFKLCLASTASQSLRSMVAHGLFPLKTDEALALLALRNALEFLVNKYNPDDMTALFDNFIKEAGLDFFSHIEALQLEISQTRSMIKRNYGEVKELIAVLDGIVQKAIVEQPSLRNYQEIRCFEQR